MWNLEFLGKSAADPKCCLLFVGFFTLKAYVYPMKSRKSIAAKMEISYREVEEGWRKKKRSKYKATNGAGV